MIPQFYEAEDGHYVAEMFVEPNGQPAVNTDLYLYFDEEVYRHTTANPVATVGYEHYFELEADPSIPIDVLGVPDGWVDVLGIRNPPEMVEVGIVSPDMAHMITHRRAGGDAVGDPDVR